MRSAIAFSDDLVAIHTDCLAIVDHEEGLEVADASWSSALLVHGLDWRCGALAEPRLVPWLAALETELLLR